MSKRCLNALLFIFIYLLQACAEIPPWQRGNLAREDMALDPNPNLSHIRDHIFTSREAGQGGRGSSGGGCGCN